MFEIIARTAIKTGVCVCVCVLPQAIIWHSIIFESDALYRMNSYETSTSCVRKTDTADMQTFAQSSPSFSLSLFRSRCNEQNRVMSYESRLAIDRYKQACFAQTFIWWWNINNDIIESCDKYSLSLSLLHRDLCTDIHKHCCDSTQYRHHPIQSNPIMHTIMIIIIQYA